MYINYNKDFECYNLYLLIGQPKRKYFTHEKIKVGYRD